MAFQIFWKIKFKSLRAGTDYTVNIYKDGTLPSGYPLTLKGGAQPFTTEEDDSEDMFTPIRTQSGYLRIVDDGWAVNANGENVRWNWKELLPSTDTDRPVTLTHQTGSSPTVDWQGFMQAQDFGSVLYGNPQERECPIQCVLTVTQGTDINYQQTAIQNFAYLLKTIIDSIPNFIGGNSVFSDILVQGGADAKTWLQKRIDWQNFVSEDSDGKLVARFSMYQCLEDMCRFWGLTARTHGGTLFLMCADDANMTNFLQMSYYQLTLLATNHDGGSTSEQFVSINLSGDIFANTNQDEFLQRGFNKAVVTSEGNTADEKVINYAPTGVAKYLMTFTPTIEIIDGQGIGYYGDLLSFPTDQAPSPFMSGSAVGNKGAFSFIVSAASDLNNTAIRIKKSYDGNTFASLQTVYQHSFYNDNDGNVFYNGGIRLHGYIWQKRYKVEDYTSTNKAGRKSMYIRLGIGKTRATAKWFGNEGWSSNEQIFEVTVGNADDLLRPKFQQGSLIITSDEISTSGVTLEGNLYIDFLGSSDLDVINGERAFFITDFNIEFERNRVLTFIGEGIKSRYGSQSYSASNGNSVRNEWNADCVYASDNEMYFGYGVILNPDGTYYKTFGNTGITAEQYLANRVVNYWQTSKRRLQAELRSNVSIGNNIVVGNINPQCKVTLDSTTGYPIAIGRDWRDDILKLTILEL